jgi:hypothetical protein
MEKITSYIFCFFFCLFSDYIYASCVHRHGVLFVRTVGFFVVSGSCTVCCDCKVSLNHSTTNYFIAFVSYSVDMLSSILQKEKVTYLTQPCKQQDD